MTSASPQDPAAQTAPTLAVWTASDDPGAAQAEARLAEVLEETAGQRGGDAAGIPSALTPVPDAAAAATLLARAPGTCLLVILPAPLAALCQAMRQGHAPSAALRLWVQAARPVAELQRRNRARVVLATPGALSRNAAQVLDRLGLPQPAADAGPDADPASQQPPGAEDPVLPILALRALRDHPTALSLAGEIEAGLILADEEEAAACVLDLNDDADTAYVRYRAAVQNRTAEMQGLAEQLLHAQGEAEQHYAGRTRLEADLRTARASLAESAAAVREKNAKLHVLSARKQQVSAKLQASQAACSELEDRARRLEQQKHQLSQGLESQQTLLREAEEARDSLAGQLEQMHDLHTDMQAEQAGLDARIAALSDEVSDRTARIQALEDETTGLRFEAEEIRASTSWRMTAPLRRLSRLIARRGAGK